MTGIEDENLKISMVLAILIFMSSLNFKLSFEYEKKFCNLGTRSAPSFTLHIVKKCL